MTAVDDQASVRRHASGAPWEAVLGYSRTVEAGPWVFVAGTTATFEGRVVADGDVYGQTVQALLNVEAALRLAGAELTDVVQTRLFVTDASRWREVGRAHAEMFAQGLPVTALVEVAGLIDPKMLIEIEAVAYRQWRRRCRIRTELICGLGSLSSPEPASSSVSTTTMTRTTATCCQL